MKEILISSSVLILVIVLFRQLFRNRVSRCLQYGLWLLVALRLLIPVQFGQSDYSVTALTEKIESESKPIQQIQESLREPVRGPSRAEIYEQLLNEYLQKDDAADQPVVPEATQPITPAIREQIETQVEEQITAPTLSEVLTAIWIFGMIGMCAWFIAANTLYLHRAKKGSEAWNGSAPVRVRISSNVPTPCLVGLFRPVIYLTPASLQDETSLNHILTHELTHLRHGDHIWSLVRCVCLCVYWFDPLVWLAAILSKRDCELACDEAALKKLGDDQRIAYGKTLLATVTQSRSPAHILETATAMNETKKQLKERVNCIVKKPRTLLIAAVILILTAAIAVGCTFTGSKSTEPPATEPTATQPQSTEPTLSEPACPTDPTTPPMFMSEHKAKLVVNNYLNLYKQYRTDGVCCQTEYNSDDLSRFLTDAQKAQYDGRQYRILCCHTPEEVNAHIARMLAPSLIDSHPDDQLFYDDQGNLYLLYRNWGHAGPTSQITIDQFSDQRIVATVELRNPDDSYLGSQIVVLSDNGSQIVVQPNNSSGFIMESLEWYNYSIDVLPYKEETYADRRQDTMELAMERFGMSYIAFLYAGNRTVQEVTEEYAPEMASSVLWDTDALSYRSLYLYNGTLTLSFPIRGIGSTGDPLAGFFAREFTTPEGDIEDAACRWFFEELPKNANNIGTYAKLFLEAFYSQPAQLLRNMAKLEDSAITGLTSRIYTTLTDWDEYQQFVQFLDSLYDGDDWTDREAEVLELLSTPPESFVIPDDTVAIAREVIDKYRKYETLRIYCDYEQLPYDDMSEYLTEKQKEEYWDYQYRITCCDTPEEVRAHARRMVSSSLFDANHPYDDLFYDDEGELYLIVLPTGSAGYYNERILQRTDTQIIAFSDCGYDGYDYSAAFVMELQDGEWIMQEAWSFDDCHAGHNSEEGSYRWLFEELHDLVDGYYTDAYAELLTDALFVEPDTFLRRLSLLEEDRIRSIADLLRHSLTSDEKEVYERLLSAIGARMDLTDAERNTLALLHQDGTADTSMQTMVQNRVEIPEHGYRYTVCRIPSAQPYSGKTNRSTESIQNLREWEDLNGLFHEMQNSGRNDLNSRNDQCPESFTELVKKYDTEWFRYNHLLILRCTGEANVLPTIARIDKSGQDGDDMMIYIRNAAPIPKEPMDYAIFVELEYEWWPHPVIGGHVVYEFNEVYWYHDQYFSPDGLPKVQPTVSITDFTYSVCQTDVLSEDGWGFQGEHASVYRSHELLTEKLEKGLSDLYNYDTVTPQCPESYRALMAQYSESFFEDKVLVEVFAVGGKDSVPVMEKIEIVNSVLNIHHTGTSGDTDRQIYRILIELPAEVIGQAQRVEVFSI